MSNKKLINPKDFYDKHNKCPDCGNDKGLHKSKMSISYDNEKDFVDNINTAYCPACRWKGKVKDLK